MAEDLLEELKDLTRRKVTLESRLKGLRLEYLAFAKVVQEEADKVDDRLAEIKKDL